MPRLVPVIALTGYLGAGKTTLLNHLLRQPGARIGVILNDFGDINIDAGLVTGQVDDPASIAGGCICCLDDDTALDDALAKLTHPRLALDAVIVEASGIAEPAALAQMIRFSSVDRVRPGGVVDVVDAVEHFHTVDDDAGAPPARYAATTLAVINKCDDLPEDVREETVTRIEERIRAVNPEVHLVRASHGRVDPTLAYDVTTAVDPEDQLPIAALLREEHDHLPHTHAQAVSSRSEGPIDPGALIDLLRDPPGGVYRLKGWVTVETSRRRQRHQVHLVGRSIHISPATGSHALTAGAVNELVAIGTHLDTDAVRRRLETALLPATSPHADGLRRLEQYLRLSS